MTTWFGVTHIGRFASVEVKVEPLPDGTLVVRYVVTEQPLLADVQVVGNKAISDQKLLGVVVLRKGDPIDPFLIDRGVKEIRRLHHDEGYYETQVDFDEESAQRIKDPALSSASRA